MLQFTRNIGRLAPTTKSAVFVSQKGSFRSFGTETTTPSTDTVSIDKSSGKIRVDFKNSFKLHKLDKGPNNFGYTNKDELMSFYRQMQVMRRLEIMADNLYKQKLIRGFLHLYNGQEAVVVGAEAATRKDDHVITAYRNHAHYLGRGGTPYEALCELMGKADGCASGKGGSMHFYRKEGNYHGGNGIVGAQGPVGTGVAFSLKYNGTDNVCLTYYGDGAANQGQLFEAYNMAMIWKLPVIFICENNKYAMGTSVERAAAVPTFYTRGDFVPGLWIDGMNVIAVREGVKFAADHCRAGKGPIILEIETYRYAGHSMSDPGLSYRSRDEVNAVKAQRDPIDKVKHFLVSTGQATEEQLKEIEKEIKKDIEETTERAKAAPVPELKALYEDVYIDKPYFVRAVERESSVIVQ